MIKLGKYSAYTAPAMLVTTNAQRAFAVGAVGSRSVAAKPVVPVVPLNADASKSSGSGTDDDEEPVLTVDNSGGDEEPVLTVEDADDDESGS